MVARSECLERWQRDEYESLEEAKRDVGDELTEAELLEEKAGWESQGYGSLEEACMDAYDAKSVEEALWDEAGIPRLLCIGENAGDKLKEAGWFYHGYKPGKHYQVSESTIKYKKKRRS
jgi:hypothetical protein